MRPSTEAADADFEGGGFDGFLGVEAKIGVGVEAHGVSGRGPCGSQVLEHAAIGAVDGVVTKAGFAFG